MAHPNAQPAALTCPHCHGVLLEFQDGGPLGYRCPTGHGFTAATLLAAQEDELEAVLEVAMRLLEERITLIRRLADDAARQGQAALHQHYEARLQEYQSDAETLRRTVTASLQDTDPPMATG